MRAATWFVRIIVGLIIGIPLIGTVVVKAHNTARLQAHAELEQTLMTSSGYFNSYMQVLAVCDTGNGVMLYITRTAGTEGTAMVAVPGGCAKVQAER